MRHQSQARVTCWRRFGRGPVVVVVVVLFPPLAENVENMDQFVLKQNSDEPLR